MNHLRLVAINTASQLRENQLKALEHEFTKETVDYIRSLVGDIDPQTLRAHIIHGGYHCCEA